MTFSAPVPRMMFTSDCIPTVAYDVVPSVAFSEQCGTLDTGAGATPQVLLSELWEYCTSPWLQHFQAARSVLLLSGCGSSWRRRITFGSLLNVSATSSQNNG